MDKQSIRERVWDALERSGEARFPFPPHDRIPNFAGADEAAERLAETAVWHEAETVKANPDAPQLPVRRAALRAGKTLFVPVPRLREADCFYRLDPAELDDYDAATTVGGVADHGEQVGPDAVDRIDLIVSGSVAVNAAGARIGKGEGYSDLEFAVLRELDLVDAETDVVTTVHEMQVLDREWDVDDHDVPLDRIVTPERAIETETSYEHPAGVDWDAIKDDRIDEIPVLAGRRPE